MAPPKYSSKRGLVNGSSAQGLVKFSIRAAPLPKTLLEFILDNVSILKRLQRERRNTPGGSADDHDHDEDDDSGGILRKPTVRPDQFWAELESVCEKAGGEWNKSIVDKIWAFGPHKACGCLLIDARKNAKTLDSYALPFRLIVLPSLICTRLRRKLDRTRTAETSIDCPSTSEDSVLKGESDHDFDHHVETGFQLATFQGPLCSEPVEGMAYFLESLEVASDETKSETGSTLLPTPIIIVG